MNNNLIDSTVLIPELTATECDSALDEVLGAIVDAGILDAGARKKVLKQLLAREAQGSTGLGNGVAVPHVKEADVAEIAVAVAINEAGIGFDSIDGRPVHIMFVVLGPKGGQPEQHLAVLRWVSTLARNADFRRFAQHVKSVEELRDLLLEMTEIA
jgi:PTS system fructose-specific IIC component